MFYVFLQKYIMSQTEAASKPVTEPLTLGTTTYAWVYVQVNQNDQNQSSGDYFMSPNDFSRQ